MPQEKKDELYIKNTFYKDFSLKEVLILNKNGLKEGECTTYYQNGNIKSKINYKNGLRKGKAIYYSSNESDKIIKTEEYKNDKLHGTIFEFYPSGNVKKIMGFENGSSKGFMEYNYIEGQYEKEENIIEQEKREKRNAKERAKRINKKNIEKNLKKLKNEQEEKERLIQLKENLNKNQDINFGF